jgi:hypothetical protein
MTISPDVESHFYLEDSLDRRYSSGPVDFTDQFSNFLRRPGERMHHAAVPADSFPAVLPEALVTQDFDEIRMSCP